MRKPLVRSAVIGTAVAVSGLLGSTAVGANPLVHPTKFSLASLTTPKGAGIPQAGNQGCAPSLDAYPNGHGHGKKDGDGTIIAKKGQVVSFTVFPHCVDDGKYAIWAIHHGWDGDPTLYLVPSADGKYGPVSWGNHPFTYSGLPVSYFSKGDKQLTITFIAADRQCDAVLRTLPYDNYDGKHGDFGPDGHPYDGYDGHGPDGHAYDGSGPDGHHDDPPGQPGQQGQSDPQGGDNQPGAYHHTAFQDDPGPGPDGPDGSGYGPGPDGFGPIQGPNAPYNGRIGFKDLPSCCRPLGDVNVKIVDP